MYIHCTTVLSTSINDIMPSCPDTKINRPQAMPSTTNRLQLVNKPQLIVLACNKNSAVNNQNYASLVSYYSQLCLCLKIHLLFLNYASIICQALHMSLLLSEVQLPFLVTGSSGTHNQALKSQQNLSIPFRSCTQLDSHMQVNYNNQLLQDCSLIHSYL